MGEHDFSVLLQTALSTVSDQITNHDKLAEAIRYALGNGGKRIRPMLLLWSHAMFSERVEDAIPFAVALELIHNYSLVHDDLPCMDDDDERRGRPTVHIAFDEATAVLTGDALLNGAFEIALQAACRSDHRDRALEAALVLAEGGGGKGMLAGQMMDLFDTIDDETSMRILNAHKTGELFVAACRCGAILGGATEEEQSSLQRYAEHLGIAFQLQDDLLDEEKDIYEQNTTAFRFLNKAEIEREITKHNDLALKALGELRKDTSQLRALVTQLIDRKV